MGWKAHFCSGDQKSLSRVIQTVAFSAGASVRAQEQGPVAGSRAGLPSGAVQQHLGETMAQSPAHSKPFFPKPLWGCEPRPFHLAHILEGLRQLTVNLVNF